MFKKIKRFFKFRKIERIILEIWMWKCRVGEKRVFVSLPWWLTAKITFDDFVRTFIEVCKLSHWYEGKEAPEDLDWKIDYCIDVLEYATTHLCREIKYSDVMKICGEKDEEKIQKIIEQEKEIDKIRKDLDKK